MALDRGDRAMLNGAIEPDPVYSIFAALAVCMVLVQIGTLSVRRWSGRVVPDYSGWEPLQIRGDLRIRLVLGLLLVTAWIGVAIAYLRQALQLGTTTLVAARVGPMQLPPWLAFVLQGSRPFLMTWALIATALWLDRFISRHWSEPQAAERRLSPTFLIGLFACTALAASVLK
jgi:hypothetical protein